MKWKCLVLFLVAVTVTGQVQDLGDYDNSWWSNEASDEQLGINKPVEYDQDDNQFHNNDFKQMLKYPEQKNIDLEDEDDDVLRDMFLDQDNKDNRDHYDQSDNIMFNRKDEHYDEKEDSFTLEKIQKQLDSSDAKSDEIAEPRKDKEILYKIQPAKQEFDSSKESLDNSNSNIDNLGDYQIEDNRLPEEQQYKAEISENDENPGLSYESENEIANIETDLTNTLQFSDPKYLEAVDKTNHLDETLDHSSEEKKLLLEEKDYLSEEDFEKIPEAEVEIVIPEDIKYSEFNKESRDKNYDNKIDQLQKDIHEKTQNEQIKITIDKNKRPSDEKEEDSQEKENVNILNDTIKYENKMIETEKKYSFANQNDDTDDGFKELALELDDDDSIEDTVDKAYKDLNDDMDKLLKTLEKFNEYSKSDESKENLVEKYEEQYNKPYGEDTILSQRQDYENYDDLNDEPLDRNLADIFDTSDSVAETDELGDNNNKLAFDYVVRDSVDKPNPEIETNQKNGNDTQAETTVKTIDVETLQPAQYNDLMVQFAATHIEDTDILREEFGKGTAAVHLTLTDTEVTEITSPNYPNTYPTNNVIDWILTGDGTGIELNITDLELRGAQGDFVLIKPGGVDDSGHDGLVFSYHLNRPRLYRFTDVSKVFVRFQSGTGLGFLKGFRMTVKIIWPPESLESEEAPSTPAPLLPSPPSVLTVTLGGIGQKDFFAIREEFQRLVADMASMYIFASDIEVGDNTTHEITQLTSTAYCNVNWPNSEQCVKVTFGVPLVYGDEEPTRLNEVDLRTMWETYSVRDPFAVRLRQMGITEFAVPDDERVLMTWLVLASGAILCAALLAFALWRYSCIEEYTRMKSFSDTDSLREEKRGLDLYPTPHQTLPPLYAESDYKWADDKYDNSSRVDMGGGGFSNSSYARDELVDIDSEEEEVVSPRDRFTTDV